MSSVHDTHNDNYTNEQVRLSGLQTTYSYRKTEFLPE